MIKLLLIGLLVTIASVAAAPSGAFILSGQAQMIDPVIESQTANGHIVWPPDEYTVVNPTSGRCVWDVDDWTHASGAGEIEAGQSVNYSQCLILDGIAHLFQMAVGVRGGNSHWLLTISIPELGWSVSAPDASFICIIGVDITQAIWDAMPIVPGSDNGDGVAFGKGQFVNVVRTITNTGSRRIGEVKADYNLSIVQTPQQIADYCGPGAGQSVTFGGGYRAWWLAN